MDLDHDELPVDDPTASESEGEEARDDVRLGKLAPPSEKTARQIATDIRRLLGSEAFK